MVNSIITNNYWVISKMKVKKSIVKWFLIIVCCFVLLLIGFAYLAQSRDPVKKSPRNSSTITEGFWTYSITITNPGTRSEGSMGRLFYKNNSLPLPDNLSDYYDTSLGIFFYVGTEGNPWDDQGWVLSTGNSVFSGKALSPPDAKADLVDQAKQNMDKLVQTISQKSAQPEYFNEIEFETVLKDKDPWGIAYRIFLDRRGGEGAGGVVRVILKSAGPDKQFDSKDDIERYSNFFPVPGTQQEPGPDDMLLETRPISEEPS